MTAHAASRPGSSPPGPGASRLLPTNSLGLLVRIVPVLLLHLLDLGDVLLLGLLGGESVVDGGLPSVVLGLALRGVSGLGGLRRVRKQADQP